MTTVTVPPLVDAYGRTAADLRISLTDKCSLRCTYCMPAGGLEWLPKAQVLTDAEIVRLAGVFLGLGVRTIRLTGGEPLVRPGAAELIGRLAACNRGRSSRSPPTRSRWPNSPSRWPPVGWTG